MKILKAAEVVVLCVPPVDLDSDTYVPPSHLLPSSFPISSLNPAAQQVASCPWRPEIQSGRTDLISKAVDVAVRVSEVQDTLSVGVHLSNAL